MKLISPGGTYKKWLLLILPLVYSHPVFAGNRDSTFTIIIKLKANRNNYPVSIKTAPLKYNKNFAFSFTLDDGLVSDYLVAFPFFSGGTVSGKYTDQWGYDQGADGRGYPGLFYTDGCGQSIPFKAGLAINAKNINDADTLLHHGFLTWKQIQTLHQSGWDILNHGYTHATGKGVNVKYEIEQNNEVVKNKLGIEMKGFVIPGGRGDIFSNERYTKAAFDLGMETVQGEGFGNYLINIGPELNLSQIKLGRLFMRAVTDTINGIITQKIRFRSGPNPAVHGTEAALFKNIDFSVNDNQTFWINAFTHGVGNKNIWNISLVFPVVKSFFNKLEIKYGEKGADNMWMAPVTEVYEYLLNARAIKYMVKRYPKKIKLVIDKKAFPLYLKYHELTFIIAGRRAIRSVRCKGCIVESYSKGKNGNLININWE